MLAMQTPKTFVDPTFFTKLGQHKLEEAKLEELSTPITGFASPAVGPNKPQSVHFSAKSFDNHHQCSRSEYILPGNILNFNTIEAFKELDKAKFISDAAARLQKLIESKEIFSNPNLLAGFEVISFADLKRYVYYYWFCFPSIKFDCTIESITREKEPDIDAVAHERLFFALSFEDSWIIDDLASLDFTCKTATVGLASFGEGLPWHLRNLCSALKPYFERARVYVSGYSGYWVNVNLQQGNETQVLGWERNSKNKLSPKVSDMSSLQNPLVLADQAVDLNLKLMKWRAAPEIELDGLKSAKCLLLGAGTLGCYIARGLLAWGVRHISLVDSGTVSYSNPVRQPLFTLEDSKSGTPKALAAAKSLVEIFPGVEAKGYQLEIPMAGHPINKEDDQLQDYNKLCELIDGHDVIFLLMDSRESRWLPTVLCQAKEKLAINVAVGFDSYVVMRHGLRSQGENQLGCYFCNDVVAPIDSVSRLSLDQMCTVTRPGVAMLAGSQAVELLATIYQSEQRGDSPHDQETILGPVSHQLRGFLRTHQTMDIWGPAFPNCSACSKVVVDTWHHAGWDFVKSALNDDTYLTEVSGLGSLQKATEELDLEWSDGELG